MFALRFLCWCSFLKYFCLKRWFAYVSFFFSSRRRHTRCLSDWSSDVCSSDLRVVRSLRERSLRARNGETRTGFALSRAERPLAERADHPEDGSTLTGFPGLV